MAGFKKSPGDQSGGALAEFIDAVAATAGQVALSYWPLVGGGLILFLLIVLGRERTAIPVGIAVVLLQAWLSFG
jgi:hypothetical protein